MELKVNLPNPDDMSIEQWFSQMRISLKAAEKAYQEALKNLTEELREKQKGKFSEREIWIHFELPSIPDIDKVDRDYDKRQNVQITINSL